MKDGYLIMWNVRDQITQNYTKDFGKKLENFLPESYMIDLNKYCSQLDQLKKTAVDEKYLEFFKRKDIRIIVVSLFLC